jgi:acyl-homoserine lactone acylase PvdQ
VFETAELGNAVTRSRAEARAPGCARSPPLLQRGTVHRLRRGAAPARCRRRRPDVRILRDHFGVPHVFGRSDADAAFGLAYAHAEDDFATIQEVLFGVRGKLASVRGPSAAPGDYVVALLGIWKDVEAGTRPRPAHARDPDGYAAGL